MEEEEREHHDSQDIKLADNLGEKAPKESIYDKIPLSEKQLNIIIILLVAAIIAFLIIGTLLGNGII